ncbi:uncharacterized protein LOC113352603 [Papaver somniferum]|uniref:uncharacterized protein LOC113352603 n=1 Tax=Papaver somniferum TaxID=3469 RepID=UPI000E6FAF02|nr:uncharacterized protein LOC113352603 [Papaver somniferum]
MEILKAVWDIIKVELMAVMKEFEVYGRLDWRLNCTSIILIPKCDGASMVHSFRHISLIGGIYKIISKLLADRLKQVLPSVISDFQGAFVDGRQITDDLGIGYVWRNWIRWCLSNIRFSMAINGPASNLFRSSKGIKQGDPMSPFLFILVVEVLSVMMKKAASMNLLPGFRPSRESFKIIYLQFADDLIVFLDDSCEQYIGIPLGSKSKAIGVWDVILHNFQKKLNMWQKRYLSKGGSSIKSVGKSLWAGILKIRNIVTENSTIQVNNGDKCLFWKDVWLNEQAIMHMFPNLFKINRLQNSTIQDMLEVNTRNNWNFAFYRALKKEEIEDIAHLLNML